MSDLVEKRPNRLGGQGDYSRQDIRMMMVAARNKRYNLTEDQRRRMVDMSFSIAESSNDERTKISAIKVLTEMDKIDATRESNDIEQRHHEVLEATAVIRTAMQAPEMMDQLAKLSDHICKPIPIDVQAEIDAVAVEDTKHVMEIMGKLSEPHKNGNGKK